MDRDIQRAIEKLDSRIRELQAARKMLIDQFGDQPLRLEDSQPTYVTNPSSTPRKSGPIGTRRLSVIEYLKTNGPAHRRTMIEKIGMPEGTMGFVLKDKSTFYQIGDGLWWLTGEPIPSNGAPPIFEQLREEENKTAASDES